MVAVVVIVAIANRTRGATPSVGSWKKDVTSAPVKKMS